VDALRRADALTVSAVAVVGSRIVGHIAFSPVTIDDHSALALAPVAVEPTSQRQGIGAALIRWGLDECRRLEHGIVIVLGEPAYYGRFGFTPAAQFGIDCPFPVPSEAFMVLELFSDAAAGRQGMVRYRPEFELV
jgi:putative acetyltransferase